MAMEGERRERNVPIRRHRAEDRRQAATCWRLRKARHGRKTTSWWAVRRSISTSSTPSGRIIRISLSLIRSPIRSSRNRPSSVQSDQRLPARPLPSVPLLEVGAGQKMTLQRQSRRQSFSNCAIRSSSTSWAGEAMMMAPTTASSPSKSSHHPQPRPRRGRQPRRQRQLQPSSASWRRWR